MFRWRVPGLWIGLLLGTGWDRRRRRRAGIPKADLKENIPNPVTRTTTIPFEIRPEVCARNHQPTVTIRIYNVLVQVVAYPTLRDSTGQRLDDLRLPCGGHEAYWDGRFLVGPAGGPRWGVLLPAPGGWGADQHPQDDCQAGSSMRGGERSSPAPSRRSEPANVAR